MIGIAKAKPACGLAFLLKASGVTPLAIWARG